tara:strand:- start:539 stop:1123 length:585 start_codon:yes stop_codon:yes gene_type:complete
MIIELEEKGWVAMKDFLPQALCLKILEIYQQQFKAGQFEQAKIGSDLSKQLILDIRVSQTCWLDEITFENELRTLQNFFNELITSLNRAFFLNLKRYESQLAFYPEGGFYKKHLDQIKGQMHRQLTSIFYLNDCEVGGELVLYDRENRNHVSSVIKPKQGTFVLFFSSQIFHEVLPTQSPRYSMTSWFRDDLAI